ncbi:MAG: hypothetical protein H8E41_12510, partial [Desulfobulbaceae bacterium]|nr:hypothetical protein [Candidatus Desulfobia pelagia]
MIFFRSQRHQLTAIIFGLITLLVSMLLWGVLTVSQSGQEQRLQAREEVLLAFVATICRGGLLTNEYADSQLLAEDLLGDPQIEKIMLADYRGRILISTSSVDIGEPFQREKLTEPTWRFQIIDNPTGTLGTLAILFSRVALEDAARELRQTSLLLALPLLLVVAGISWLLGSLLSRRLEMLTAAMRQVADGKLET